MRSCSSGFDMLVPYLLGTPLFGRFRLAPDVPAMNSTNPVWLSTGDPEGHPRQHGQDRLGG